MRIPAYDPVRRKFHHFSPSLLQAFEDCERIPYYDKILRLRREQTAAQALGTRMHSQLEKLVIEGVDTLEPRLRGLRKYLPEKLPAPGVFAELGLDGQPKHLGKPYDHSEAPAILGIPIEGYIDLMDFGRRQVTDYKTSKDVTAWAKTEEQLRNNLQLGIYAHWVRQETWAGDVRARHLYAQTEGDILCKEVPVVLESAQIDKVWGRAEKLAEGLLRIEKLESDDTIGKTGQPKGFCTKYYGKPCPYAATCLRAPSAMLALAIRNANKEQASNPQQQEPEKGNDVSLFAKLAQQPAAPAPETPKAPPAPQAQAAETSTQANWKEAYCQCCGEPAGKRPQGHQVAAHDGCKNPGGRYEATPAGVRVLYSNTGAVTGTLGPVQAAPSPQGSMKISTEVEPAAPEDLAKAEKARKGILPPDAPPNDKDRVVEEKPAKKGKKGTVTQPSPIPPAPSQTQQVAPQANDPAGSIQADGLAAGRPAPDAGGGKLPIKLFVNCFPPEPFVYLDAYAAEKAAIVAKALQVDDYRLTDLGAVKGRGGLAAIVREQPPAPGVYVAMTSGFDGPMATVVEALVPLVAYPVRGAR